MRRREVRAHAAACAGATSRTTHGELSSISSEFRPNPATTLLVLVCTRRFTPPARAAPIRFAVPPTLTPSDSAACEASLSMKRMMANVA